MLIFYIHCYKLNIKFLSINFVAFINLIWHSVLFKFIDFRISHIRKTKLPNFHQKFSIRQLYQKMNCVKIVSKELILKIVLKNLKIKIYA